MITFDNFKDAVISGANNLTNNKQIIDEMNIFPVPDGDTGTNMSLTMNSSLTTLQSKDFKSIYEVSSVVASLLLRGARGNSGAILSLIFKGMSMGLENLKTATARDLLNGLSEGVKKAYQAVMKPTEGTILTVARMAYEESKIFLDKNENATVAEFWLKVCDAAEEALAMTPNLLPVLKKVGVVDAGGKGLCLIFEGMLSVFKDDKIIKFSEIDISEKTDIFLKNKVKSLVGVENDLEKITFPYCTELIIKKKDLNDEKALKVLRTCFENIGDCVVVISDNEIIKVHVHTEDPGKVLSKATEIGELLIIKVDNMLEQRRELMGEVKKNPRDSMEFCTPEEEIGFVAVCNGSGIKNLFYDLGCTKIVTGGQSMNPSAEDIAKAVLAVGAKTVFVLPNNKNIVLSANQASSLVDDRKIIVVETKSIPQGMSAMLSYNPDSSPKENLKEMLSAAAAIKTGQITFASRNAEFGGIKVKKNDIIGLVDGKLILKAKDSSKAAVKLIFSIAKKDTEFITIIYGKDISDDEAEIVKDKIQSKFGSHADISLISGGQPIYHFIVSVE